MKRKLSMLLVAAAMGLSACQSNGSDAQSDNSQQDQELLIGKHGTTRPPEAVSIDDGAQLDGQPVQATRLDSVEKLSVLFDKKLTRGPTDFFYYRRNGRLVGTYNGSRYSGNWEMVDGFLCRKLNVTGAVRFKTDCQLLTLNGKEFTIIREKGNGPTLVYEVEG